MQEIRQQLAAFDAIEIVGLYTNPSHALAELGATNPDCAFLDIEMPGIGGIDLAEKLAERNPRIQIVFVTAFNHYATQAFEVDALDYVLKPIHPERLRKTAHRLLGKHRQEKAAVRGEASIASFGGFELRIDGCPVKWNRSKAKEALAYLLHYHGQKKHKYAICEALWPDFEPKKALVNLQTAMYSLRKSLGDASHESIRIEFADECYTAKLGRLDWDALEFDKLNERWLRSKDLASAEKAATLYLGPYMGNEDWPWSQLTAAGLAAKYGDMLVGLAKSYFEDGLYGRALETGLRLLKNQPDKEAQLLLLRSAYRGGGTNGLRQWAITLQQLCRQDFDTDMEPEAVEYCRSKGLTGIDGMTG